MATKDLDLNHLTQPQIREIIRLKNSYVEDLDLLEQRREFALLDRDEAMHLLEESAEIVIRIRHHLEKHDSGYKLRSLSGDAPEYLWGLEKIPAEGEFVKGLARASLQLQGKFVCDLNDEKLNSWFRQIYQFRIANQNETLAVEGSVLEDDLLKTWNEVDVLLKVTVAKDLEKTWNSSLVADMQHLVKQVTGFKRRIELIQRKREFVKKRRTSIGEKTERDTKEREMKQNEKSELEKKDLAKEQERKEQERKEQEKKDQEKKEQEKLEKEKQEKEKLLRAEDDKKKEEARIDAESVVRIKLVSADVDQISSQIQDVTKAATDLRSYTSSASQALAKIEELRKRCSAFSSALMNDLIRLDELAGLHEAKALKKQEIDNIQHLLDDVDKLKSNLGKFEVELKPSADREKSDEILAKADAEFEKMDTNSPKREDNDMAHAHEELPLNVQEKVVPEEKKDETVQQLEKLASKTEQKLDYRTALGRLRLDPRIEVEEQQTNYVVYITLPGMKKDDISIEISPESRTLSVEGLRVPTTEEEAQMRKMIRARHSVRTSTEEDLFLLKYSVGRFGKFSRTYQIPPGVDLSDIKGNFKEGILILMVPKGKPRQIPVQFQKRAQFAPNQVPFYGDSSVWW